MDKPCLLVTLITSSGLGVLCQEHKAFDDCRHLGNHGRDDFAGFADSCHLTSCTPDYGISGAQSKIEFNKTNFHVIMPIERPTI